MPRARSRHRCDECGCTISRGRFYYRSAGIFDRRWEVTKLCATCAVHVREFFHETNEQCYTSGEVRDYTKELAREEGWRKFRAKLRLGVEGLKSQLRRKR
jgi:hypothetical protein